MEAKTERKKTKNTKTSASDDPQIFRPDLRFAIKSNSKATQNGAGATPKTPKQIHGMASRHGGVSPTVSQVCTNEFISGQDNANGEKTRQLQESSVQLRLVTVHYGRHLRVLSVVLCQSSKRLSSSTRTLP